MNLNLTILGQAIAFALFVWFCLKFVWPPLTNALKERQQKIADGLDAAESAQNDRLAAESMLAEKVNEGKNKARELLAEAEKRSQQIVDAAKQQAEKESQTIKEKAQEDLQMEANRIREELRLQLSGLVVEGVEQILRQQVDASAHEQYLKTLAQKL